ncbi:MAG: diacylglycerol kinase family lipid kinase [Nitrospirae bacterium]|nr:diacylglycerol kinase family lipid kinase [Nitrospirota bacterium]
MDARKPALILNPVAGPVWRRWKARRLIEHLKTLYPDLVIHPTVRAGDGERLARTLSSGPLDLILVAGGDGTYHEVINGMRDSSIPLGILPMGTGNSLVRELGLPANPFRAATAIRNGVVRPVYLGQCDQRLFILMVGAGFDAEVVRSVPPGKKKWGMPAYMLAGIEQLFRYGYPTLTFRVDGKELKGTSGIIAKARCYGGPFAIVPQVRLDRPELILCLFKGRGPMTYMKYMLGVITGLHTRMSDVEFHGGTTIEVESPAPLQADGEAIGIGPARLTILPKPMNLVYPLQHRIG